jgi:hypothetical protein
MQLHNRTATLFPVAVSHLGYEQRCRWVSLISDTMYPRSQAEEFRESTIAKRRYQRAPERAYLLSLLRAFPSNRNVGVEAAGAVCHQVTGAKEPGQVQAGKVLGSTAGPAPVPSRFWLSRGRAMPKLPCCGSSS